MLLVKPPPRRCPRYAWPGSGIYHYLNYRAHTASAAAPRALRLMVRLERRDPRLEKWDGGDLGHYNTAASFRVGDVCDVYGLIGPWVITHAPALPAALVLHRAFQPDRLLVERDRRNLEWLWHVRPRLAAVVP